MNIKSKLTILVAIIVSLSFGLTKISYSDGHGAGMAVPKIEVTTVLEGMKNPWDMAFTNDGKAMFFTEKLDGLSVLIGGKVHKLIGMKGSSGYEQTASDLFSYGAQEGMLGVVLDSDFDNNRTLYLYSTSNKYHGDGCKTNFERCDGNIVMKWTVADDMKSLSNRVDIVKDIQFKPYASDQPFGGPGAHNGGRIRIGPDGYLWVGTGDRHRGICPQDNSLICGVVLRIDGDGNGHGGNKIAADKRIYTYGHRNVQGIDFRPSDGRAFTAEHGPWHNDEITMLVNGGNGGWDPAEKRGGRSACPDQYCGYEPNQMDGMDPSTRAAYTPMSDTRFDDLMPPAWQNNGYSQGTGSAAFLKGANWGIYEGRLATGIMGIAFGDTPAGSRIDIVDIADNGLSVKSVIHMPMGMSNRYRGLVLGPDGALYVSTDEGGIYKVTASH